MILFGLLSYDGVNSGRNYHFSIKNTHIFIDFQESFLTFADFSFHFKLLLMRFATRKRKLNTQVSVRITGGFLQTVSHTFLWLTK